MYRSPQGDYEYFVLINELAKGHFGEFATYELKGSGVQSFPAASVIFHAIGTVIFGPLAGYILGDVIVTFLFFLVLRSWCGLVSNNHYWAAFLSALITSGFLPEMNSTDQGAVQIGRLWGERVPRPFVTDLYLLAGITLLTWMTMRPEVLKKFLPWAMLGAIMAFSLQSLVYLLPVLGMGFIYLLLQASTSGTVSLRSLLFGIVYSALSFFLLITPFIYQRVYESRDSLERLGVFPIDRAFIWVNTPWGKDPNALLGLFYVFLMIIANYFSEKLGCALLPKRVFGMLFTLQLGAYLAIPLTATLTGKLIQASHFFMVTAAVQTCLFVLLIAMVGRQLLPAPLRNPLFGAVVLLLAFCIRPFDTVHRHLLNGPLRRDMSNPPGADYHTAFSSLVRELQRDDYKDDQVIATIDDQVYVYWVGFKGRYAFFPQSFTTSISNTEAEDRILWFARIEGLDKYGLQHFINQHYMLVDWLGACRFQFSPLYHKNPIADYSDEDIKNITDRIKQSRHGLLVFDGFNLALPLSDNQRLQRRYAQIQGLDWRQMPRLDLIILTTDTKLFELPDPDPTKYKLVYRDDYFRIWKSIDRNKKN
jgi:hypothetical protein